jgi:predicted transcriptional regulator
MKTPVIFYIFYLSKVNSIKLHCAGEEMTIIICLVGTHYRRAFDGIRYWSKIHGITQLYLLYSDSMTEIDTNVFNYMSKQNAVELKDKLEILDPVVVSYNPIEQRSAFKVIYRIMQKAREEGEEVLIDITSTTNITMGIALTISLMFRNARVYTVPSKEPAWYVQGNIGDRKFQEWFKNARNQASRDPTELELPGYRLEPQSKHEEKEWKREKRLIILLHENGGNAESISDIIRWFGYKTANSTLRNRFSRIVSRLEMKGFVDAEKGSKMKVISLTEFGKIFAEALAEGNEI